VTSRVIRNIRHVVCDRNGTERFQHVTRGIIPLSRRIGRIGRVKNNPSQRACSLKSIASDGVQSDDVNRARQYQQQNVTVHPYVSRGTK